MCARGGTSEGFGVLVADGRIAVVSPDADGGDAVGRTLIVEDADSIYFFTLKSLIFFCFSCPATRKKESLGMGRRLVSTRVPISWTNVAYSTVIVHIVEIGHTTVLCRTERQFDVRKRYSMFVESNPYRS